MAKWNTAEWKSEYFLSEHKLYSSICTNGNSTASMVYQHLMQMHINKVLAGETHTTCPLSANFWQRENPSITTRKKTQGYSSSEQTYHPASPVPALHSYPTASMPLMASHLYPHHPADLNFWWTHQVGRAGLELSLQKSTKTSGQLSQHLPRTEKNILGGFILLNVRPAYCST